MKTEDKKRLVISICMIILLGGISFWRFKNYDPSKINVSFPNIDSSEIESLESILDEKNLEKIAKDLGFSPEENENINYKRETIEDLIVFDYPSSWRVPAEESPSDKEELYIIFTAYADKAMFPSSVSVIKISAKNIDEVETILKEDISYTDFALEEKSDNEYAINISINYSERLKGHIRGKVFFLNEEHYVVSVASFKESLATPESVNEYILSSIQIIN